MSGLVVQKSTEAFAFEQIAASDSPKKLSESIFSSNQGYATKAFITCDGFVRYRYDSCDPTMELGHIINDGGAICLYGLQIQSFRFVGTGVLAISYERE